jgi:hypothetical protein
MCSNEWTIIVDVTGGASLEWKRVKWVTSDIGFLRAKVSDFSLQRYVRLTLTVVKVYAT